MKKLKQFAANQDVPEVDPCKVKLFLLFLVAHNPANGWSVLRSTRLQAQGAQKIPRAFAPHALVALPPDLTGNQIVSDILRWHKGEPPREQVHVVTENEAGERLIKVAASRFDNLGSHRQAQTATKRGLLLVNDVAVEQSRRVRMGDMLKLQTQALQAPSIKRLRALSTRFVPELRAYGLRVVHEDDDVAVVFKPPRVHVKAGSDPKLFALEDALPAELSPPPPVVALPAPLAMHRLDTHVSGLCVIAKTRAAALSLAYQFRTHTVTKTYHALLVGNVLEDQQLIRAPVDGRWAETEVELLSVVPSVEWGSLSTVRLRPRTGRTHQLRVHAAEVLGCPIVGDELYWKTAAAVRHSHGHDLPAFRKLKKGGLFLQSCGVCFQHPDGSQIQVVVPETKKFDRLRRHALKVAEHTQQQHALK